jgi:hypothetical protein
MLNEILNLEGVAVLSKEQQKSVNGGGYPTDPVCTGRTMVVGESTVVNECKYKYQRTFLGYDWGPVQDLAESNAYKPCPQGFMC